MPQNNRKPEFPVNKIFPDRWSQRAMSGEPISNEELFSLFEAAKWAPSAFNNQPWRFIYAKKGSKYWDVFYNLISSGNKSWAKNAAVLVTLVSKKTFEYDSKPDRTHSLNAGASWENLALQGSSMGLVVHGMSGFDYDMAREKLGIPDDFDVEMMFAVGKKGKVENLTPELQKREFPSDRKKLSEIVFEGKMVV